VNFKDKNLAKKKIEAVCVNMTCMRKLANTPKFEKGKPSVDIIIPVYKGFEETTRCIYSVIVANPKISFQIHVINDCSPEPELTAWLQDVAEMGLINLYVMEKNVGFVAAVNLGMGLNPEQDVVLLNSDTEVYGDWLDRLHTVAYRNPSIATVTPFSSNAEICSYPVFCRDNPFELEISGAELDALMAKVNIEGQVEIPTAVGFCMYIKRECLNQIGFFDAKKFGLGYGEENEFCLRAIDSGWKNVLAPNVYVRHFGAVSFGANKAKRVKRALSILREDYPYYEHDVASFCRSDPIRPYREAVDVARVANHLRSKEERRFLFISHNWGGGTERHVQNMITLLREQGFSVLVMRPVADDDTCLHLEDAEELDVPNFPKISLHEDIESFTALLENMGITNVHVHHLIGLNAVAPDFIRKGCQAAQIPYDVTIHDYFPICPRINMINSRGYYCTDTKIPNECSRCIKTGTRPAGGDVSIWDWRDRYERFLQKARCVFVPNADVSQRIGKYFADNNIAVRPHPEIMQYDPSLVSAHKKGRARSGALRIALLGAIGPQKGSHLLHAVAVEAYKGSLPIEFVVVGFTDRDALLKQLPNIRIIGAYKEEEELQQLLEVNADFVWIASISPETYSYTLSAVFTAGLPAVAFDFGAIADRIRKHGYGELLPLELMLKPGELVSKLLEIGHKIEKNPKPFTPVSYPDLLKDYYSIVSVARTFGATGGID